MSSHGSSEKLESVVPERRAAVALQKLRQSVESLSVVAGNAENLVGLRAQLVARALTRVGERARLLAEQLPAAEQGCDADDYARPGRRQ